MQMKPSSATRAFNDAARGLGVVNGSLRYLLETALVVGAVLIVAAAGAAGAIAAALPAVGLVLAAAFRLLPALNRVFFARQPGSVRPYRTRLRRG